jgi:hypothetical protein
MQFSFEMTPQAALMGGVAMLYAAGRAAVVALAHNASSPGRRALGHWMPIAAVTAAAVVLHEPLLAMSVIFATSVATLALAGGAVALSETTPQDPAYDGSPHLASFGGLLLPAALLALLAGFSGQIGWFNAAALALEGLAVLYVWRDWIDAPEKPEKTSSLNLVLAILLALVGAWIAVKGAIGATHLLGFVSPGIVATSTLAPLLAAPMLLSGANLAQQGRAWAAWSTHIAVVQLNLCVLLPLTALFWLLRWHTPLAFPLATWRVDAVVLVLLAAITGRRRPGNAEGFFLMILFVGYVLAVIGATLRT